MGNGIDFNKLNVIESSSNVSQLSNQLSNAANNNKRRRSSVFRRMSVGNQINLNTTIQIDIHLKNNETEDNYNECVIDEDESESDDDDDDDNDNDDQDTELYKRSSSQTPACKITDFKPLKVLGQGAYGKVLLVKNQRTGKLFAQKELKKASVRISQKSIERTLSERKILSKITSHNNIVKLFYALHDNSKLYLLMEYIPGGELFKYLINENFLNDRKASFYIIQMSLALKFLHKFGIVYRDLKPENCMLDKNGYLILTDFGLAKKSSNNLDDLNNFCNSIIGTPEYCAPEILKGENYGNLADWWSLGCVTFDLLTGNPPFTGNNHKKIIDKVLNLKLKYPFHLTTESKEILNKLLIKNSNKRFNVDNNWEVFQKFRFFRYYSFNDIENRIVTPPIIPIITDLEKAENFDPEFTNMKLSNLDIPNVSNNDIEQPDDCFNGFSYTASNSFVDKFN